MNRFECLGSKHCKYNIKYILDLRDFPDSPFGHLVTHDFNDIINDKDIQIVAEMMGGSHPAYEFTKSCLEAGKSVVTSNKEVVATFGTELLEIAAAHGVDVISMIAPTSENRIKAIASEAAGFLYVVSSMGVTGVRSEIKTDLKTILAAIREAADIPAGIGFGINTPQQAAEMAQLADAVIVGSAIVRIIARHGKDSAPFISDYVGSMKNAIRNL